MLKGRSGCLKGCLLPSMHFVSVDTARETDILWMSRFFICAPARILLTFQKYSWLPMLGVHRKGITGRVAFACSGSRFCRSLCIARRYWTRHSPYAANSTLVKKCRICVAVQDIRLSLGDLWHIWNIHGVFLVPRSGWLCRLLTVESEFLFQRNIIRNLVVILAGLQLDDSSRDSYQPIEAFS